MKTITITFEATDEQAETLDRLGLTVELRARATLWQDPESKDLLMVLIEEYTTTQWVIQPNGYSSVLVMEGNMEAEGWECIERYLPDGTED